MRTLFFTVVIAALVTGCSKKVNPEQGNCEKHAIVPVDGISRINDHEIEVNFHVFSGCGQFGKFIEKDSAGIHVIKVEAVYKGCVCTMDIPMRKATYHFNNKKSGTYYLHFAGEGNSFVGDTIIVK